MPFIDQIIIFCIRHKVLYCKDGFSRLCFISRALIQVYPVVKLIFEVFIIAYISFGDFIGEFQVLTLNTL
jgi:hypothetical protein